VTEARKDAAHIAPNATWRSFGCAIRVPIDVVDSR